MNTSSPVIELRDVSFEYNDTTVLDHITFTIQKGDYVGLLGPNGGGKTTLLKVILGLIVPSSGTVDILGENVALLKHRSLIGYVPQRVGQGDLSFPATVEEIVASGRTPRLGAFHRLTKKDWEIVHAALDTADILPYRKRLIGQLSGGQRQRVFIARALASEPEILILDEPSTGVDVPSQEKFYALLRKLNRDRGLTILFVSHDIDVVANESHSVLCLNRKLVCHVSPQEFIKEAYMEQLYGKKMNFLAHHHS